MTFKEKTYNHFLQLLESKISVLQNNLADLRESGANETKSTAGDKHETALAMLQIEQANLRNQLNALLEQKEILKKINPSITTQIIVTGSLIKTNKGFLFLSVALGKSVLESESIIALSMQSPLGQKLKGLQTGNKVTINQVEYMIETLY